MKDELLIKFLLKEANEAESNTVKHWLQADVANLAYFTQFEKIWNAGKNLSATSDIDEDQAWLRFKERTNANSLTNDAVIKPIGSYFNWLKIAAVFVLITGAWIAYSMFGTSAYTEVVAGNQVRIETLPDGSELTLNKNAALSYLTDFKSDRHIKLTKGDVFFSVAHDKTKPFVIAIDQISVTVVGTSFNIKHLKGQTEVIVETGIVKVNMGNQEIELRKGEKVLISGASEKLLKVQNTDQLYNYYRSKLFIAKSIPLSRLISVLNEAYNSQIVITDPAVAEEPIFTTLKESNSLDYNLKNICETMDLKVSRNQNQIILSKNK